MVYFCADDYGISANGNICIEQCLKDGALNKISIFPNGQIEGFKTRLSEYNAELSLHINLVEGIPLTDAKDIDLLVSEDGYFKYSFVGLFLLSLSSKRKKLKKQLYTEIRNQLKFWKEQIGEDVPVSIDSHQHTHMIPGVFGVLMQAIKDENLSVKSLRFPAEPASPYILNPTLYSEYSFTGLVKHWLLKILGLLNHKKLKKSNIESAYFMGIMFSGKLNETRVKKLLPRYLKIAEKKGKNVEIGFHPGYSETGEKLIDGCRKDFEKFYFSPWRRTEYDTLMNFEIRTQKTKEGSGHALY